eukprot:GGOE01007894.1.p1 GENE.GGOE01007894.1~~GGOE01007894.1.p1  ORF type:complete len:330 (+),score=89.53 GGOE01007894.1:52-990(+)
MAGVVTAYVLPSIGVVLSGALYVSSLPTVRRAVRQRALETLDATTLAMQFINSLMWLRYAVLVGDPFVWWSNAPGLLLTAYYVAALLFLSGGKGDGRLPRLIARIVGVGGSYLLIEVMAFAFLLHDARVVQLIAGLSTNVWLAGMYLAPVLNVARAVRERSAAAFVVPLVIVTLLNSCMWFGYGLLACGDPFIYVPNVVGLVAALVQLGVILLFWGKKSGPNSVLLPVDTEAGHPTSLPTPPFEVQPATQAVDDGAKRSGRRTSFPSGLPDDAHDGPLLAHQIVHASLSMLSDSAGRPTGPREHDDELAQRP